MPERFAHLTALIVNRQLCMSCIANAALIPSAEDLSLALDRISHVLVVRRERGRCEVCGRTTTVVSVTRPE